MDKRSKRSKKNKRNLVSKDISLEDDYKWTEKFDKQIKKLSKKLQKDTELFQWHEDFIKNEMEQICDQKNTPMFLAIIQKKNCDKKKRKKRKSIDTSSSQKKINFYFKS